MSPPDAFVVTLAEKHVRVVSRLMPPYLEKVKDKDDKGNPLTGNDRFEGYVVDFLKALSEKLKFTYTLQGGIHDKTYYVFIPKFVTSY